MKKQIFLTFLFGAISICNTSTAMQTQSHLTLDPSEQLRQAIINGDVDTIKKLIADERVELDAAKKEAAIQLRGKNVFEKTMATAKLIPQSQPHFHDIDNLLSELNQSTEIKLVKRVIAEAEKAKAERDGQLKNIFHALEVMPQDLENLVISYKP